MLLLMLSHARFFCDPTDCSPPGSSVQGIFQARILEWPAISFWRGLSRPRIKSTSPALAGRFFITEPPGKPHFCCVCVCVLVAQLCPTLCHPIDCSPPGSSVHADSPGKNTGVGCHALLQGIFMTQGPNPGLLHCRKILHHLSHQGN